MTTFTIPPDTRTPGTVNPPGDMNQVSDMLGLLSAVLAQFAGYPSASSVPADNAANVTGLQKILGSFLGPGLAPSADSTGATDTANVQNLLSLGVQNVSLQAAPLAAPFYLNQVTPPAGTACGLNGAGIGTTYVQWNTSDTAISFAGNTGSQRFTLTGLNLIQNGTGDMIACGSSSGDRLPQLDCTEVSFTLGSSNTAGMIINATQEPSNSAVMADCFFLRCNFVTNSATRTNPGISVIGVEGGGVSSCVWSKCGFFPSDNEEYCVSLTVSSVAGDNNFHAAMALRDCRFEKPLGGAVYSLSGRNLVLDGCTFWDLSLSGNPALGNSLVYVGSQASQIVSEGTKIVNCNRDLGLTTGGNAGTGVWDIQFDSTVAQATIDSYTTVPGYHTTADPAYFNFGGCHSVTIINPQDATATDATQYQISNPATTMIVPSQVPAVSMWMPSDLAYIAQAYDQVNAATGTTQPISTQVLTLIGVQVRTYVTAANVDLYIQTAGNTLTTAENLIGLYNSAGTLLGYSADQTTAWGVTTGNPKAAALTAESAGSLALTPGLYWIALLANGTTGPAFAYSQNLNSQFANGRLGVSKARYAKNGSGLAALPTSITPSSNTLAQITYWAALY